MNMKGLTNGDDSATTLTKRETFALAILVSLVNQRTMPACNEDLTIKAISIADELIDSLNLEVYSPI